MAHQQLSLIRLTDYYEYLRTLRLRHGQEPGTDDEVNSGPASAASGYVGS